MDTRHGFEEEASEENSTNENMKGKTCKNRKRERRKAWYRCQAKGRESCARRFREEVLRQKIRDKRRVASVGDDQFGHCLRSPGPTKSLIRAPGMPCPVELVDEFCMSLCCYGCSVPLQQADCCRGFRCLSPADESRACSVGFLNRDTNSSVNNGVCGMVQLLGLASPSFLCRASVGDECVRHFLNFPPSHRWRR